MKKTIVQIILVCSISIMSLQKNQAQNFEPEWKSLKKHNAVPEWFENAKLGVYFHWGIYSVPASGGEWYPRWMYVPDRIGWGSEIYKKHKETYGEDFEYHDFIPEWKADKFSAKEWVDMFENMGAKFIGSIAEHHDGFSLWSSKVNEWNSVKMGPGINMVKEIADETKKRNLKFMATFHHGFHNMFYPKQENTFLRPGSKYAIIQDSVLTPQDEKYSKLYCNMDYTEAQDLWLEKLNEVIDEFCPDYIWMDFGQRFISEKYRQKFLANYFNKAATENKEVVVNTKGSFFPTELAVVNVERATMEDITPEVWITDFILGSNWCYNKDNRTAIDPKIAVKIIAEVVSKNGVVLFSAGPMANGTMPAEQVKTMEEIGAWMNLYGEAIYNTKPFITYGEGTTQLKRDPADAWNAYGAIKKGLNKLNAEDIRFTTNGKIVYAIQLGWNEINPSRVLKTFASNNKNLNIKSVTVLGSNEKIKWKKTTKGLILNQPTKKPLEADAALVYKITLK